MDIRLEGAYAHWRRHPFDKRYIGKQFNMSVVVRITLKIFELFGFKHFAETVYKKRFYAILPQLNTCYLKNRYNLTDSSPELSVMKKSGHIPAKKAIWEVKEAVKKLGDIHSLFQMRRDNFFNRLMGDTHSKAIQRPYVKIPHLSKHIELFQQINELRSKTTQLSEFERIALLML